MEAMLHSPALGPTNSQLSNQVTIRLSFLLSSSTLHTIRPRNASSGVLASMTQSVVDHQVASQRYVLCCG
ncbi:hypothetical protein I308_106474 [Cryptococcus tetragattii IND107]|uniref:Uncharacterized protein n=1 Tax=Cryptococcus tetragattii IND107 TaxID=1296105 RepID=A0ABR3BJA6_9TREE